MLITRPDPMMSVIDFRYASRATQPRTPLEEFPLSLPKAALIGSLDGLSFCTKAAVCCI